MKRPRGSRFETYPGLDSFRDDESSRKLYFGREAEKQVLLDLVVGESLAVLFSRSGLGKTSLINAGLKQPLRERGYFPAVARVTLLADPVKSVILAIRLEAARAKITMTGGDTSSLWQFLNTARFERDGRSWKLVLILDQFEELFTRVREASPDQEQPFIDDLANVVRRRLPADIRLTSERELEDTDDEIQAANERGDRSQVEQLKGKRAELVRLLYETAAPDVKVLIVIREDYLADLERLREPMPAIFHKVMRLDPLTPVQARCAIEQPAARDDIQGKDVFSFEDAAVTQILEFLQKRTADTRILSDASIDPGQLQLICQNVDANRAEKLITAKELGGEKGMQRILQSFYHDTVSSIPVLRIGRNAQKSRITRANFILFNRARAAARRLCQRGLITRGGHRDSVMRETIHSRYGVVDGDLKTLEGKKLIRSTMRLERDFFELSHDTLVKPVQAAAGERRIAYFVAAYLIACVIPFFVPYYKDWKGARENRRLGEEVRARHVDFSNQNLSGRTLSEVDWSRGSLVRASLSEATFTGVPFAYVDMTAADVTNAKFDGSRFFECKMSFAGEAASFAGTKIVQSNMTEARLPWANFANAEITHTSLKGTVLDNAKFVGTTIEDVDVTGTSVQDADFTGTAWWMALGWSAAQMRDLSARYPVEAIVASNTYQVAMAQFATRLNRGDRLESDVYNERAWYRVTRGAELDQAIADAELALLSNPNDSAVLDTRAYARLQKGDVDGALADSHRAVEIEKSGVDGELVYHLALAELAAGKHADAAAHFQVAIFKRYKPTYELVLTPPDNPLKRREAGSLPTTAKK